MNKRYIGVLILAPLILFLFAGGMILRCGVLVLSLLGLFEYFKVSKLKGIKPVSIVAYISCIAYFATLGNSFTLNLQYYKLAFSILILVVFIMLLIPVINTKYNYIDIGVTLLGLLYIPVFFGFIVLVNQKQYGSFLIWLIFLSSWLCDTCAYYTGRFLGKHKLCPEVSPKKTIEGSIGGLIGSSLACGIFGFFIRTNGVSIALIHFFIIGLLCGVFCQFGDLVASSIKRYVGVKDYSNLIPGHGGILDRFDSILFASLVVYYYITFIMGM